MTYTTLISVQDLADHINDPNWLIVDCRFDLSDPGAGRLLYQEAHIPHAFYAHLDEDLCTDIIPGVTGRHPLPRIDDFIITLGKWGITTNTQVVTYDDKGGGLAASRLWWMLRWLGHEPAAVLNGGWQHWVKNEYPIESGSVLHSSKVFYPKVRPGVIVDAQDVGSMAADPESLILDARSLERYRGEIEPIDPIAGHIPGAKSAPHLNVIDADGLFLSKEDLHDHFLKILENVPADKTAIYCGSGVTAIQNILAMLHSGLGEAKLYAGSWSDWITDPNRPVETS